MFDDLRPQIVHLAASFPKGSTDRTALLRVLKASEVEFGGTASDRQHERFARDLSGVAGDAGKLTYLRVDDPRSGTGWTAIFDTEFAALRVYYRWRKINGVNLGKAMTPGGGWFVSVIR